MYHSSLDNILMSSAKMLIAFEIKILPTLNPTLNLTKVVNKSKCEAKAH